MNVFPIIRHRITINRCLFNKTCMRMFLLHLKPQSSCQANSTPPLSNPQLDYWIPFFQPWRGVLTWYPIFESPDNCIPSLCPASLNHTKKLSSAQLIVIYVINAIVEKINALLGTAAQSMIEWEATTFNIDHGWGKQHAPCIRPRQTWEGVGA